MQQPWIKIIAAAAIAATLLTGCGQGKQAADRGAGSTPTPPALPLVSTPPPAQQQKSLSIKAYYGDSDGMKLVQEAVTIRYASDSEKYLAALGALKTAPNANATALCTGIDFKSAILKDGTLTVNLVINKGGQLGSEGEDLLLQSLQQTLFQFSELNAIDILVDGKQVDSLMGHMDLPHPIKRAG